MKKLTCSLFLLALAPLGSLSAAVVTFDGLAYEDVLNDLPNWSTSESNSTAKLIAWAEPVAGNMAGAFGGAYAEAVNNSASVRMDSTIYSSITSVSMDIMLKESTSLAPGRDTFGIGVESVAGASLVDIVFSPAITVNGIARWEVGYSVGGGDISYTGFVLNEDAWYDIGIDFSGSSFTLTFANSLGSINVPGTIAGFDGATNGLGDLVFNWDKNPATPYGDNYMLFDNVNVTAAVPEPSAALLTGLGALVLLRRRR